MLLRMNKLPNLNSRGARFQHARKAAKLTQAGAAEKLGISPQAISAWERDEDTPALENMERASSIYGVPMDWLSMKPGAHVATPTAPSSIRVPIVSRIKAGLWSPVWNPYENGGETVLFTEVQLSDQAFALELDGSSMEPDFYSGDVVVIDPRVSPIPGDFVAAKIDSEEEATFKKYRPRNGGVIELVPSNPDWPTLIIDKKHPGAVIGTMVEYRRYRRRRR